MKPKPLIKLLLVFVLVIVSTLTPLFRVLANAEELPQEAEVVETTETENEKSEIAEWWDEKVMPQIFTFVAGASGTGVVAVFASILIKKSFKALKDRLEKQIEANAKTKEEYEARQKQLDLATAKLEEALTEAMNKRLDAYDEKLNEALEKLQLQHEEYLETKAKGEKLGNLLIETFSDK